MGEVFVSHSSRFAVGGLKNPFPHESDKRHRYVRSGVCDDCGRKLWWANQDTDKKVENGGILLCLDCWLERLSSGDLNKEDS